MRELYPQMIRHEISPVQTPAWISGLREVGEMIKTEREEMEKLGVKQPSVAIVSPVVVYFGFLSALDVERRLINGTLLPYESVEALWSEFLKWESSGRLTPGSKHYDEVNRCDTRKLIRCMDRAYFGIIRQLRADVVVLTHSPKSINNANGKALLSKYDIVINLSVGKANELPSIHGQVRLWLPAEPQAIDRLGSKNQPLWHPPPPDHCPVVLDPYVNPMPNPWKLFPFWYTSDASGLRDTFDVKAWEARNDSLIFRPPVSYVCPYDSCRDRAQTVSLSLKTLGLEIDNRAPESVGSYLRWLSRAKYYVLRQQGRNSSGQVVVDCALMKVIPFSHVSRWFGRLLLPRQLQFIDVEDVLSPLAQLSIDARFRGQMREEIGSRLSFLDPLYWPNPAQLLAGIQAFHGAIPSCQLSQKEYSWIHEE